MELNKEYIRSLSNEDLFQILKSYDNSIGPVIPSTRSVYENKLIKMFENKVLLKIKQQSSAQSTNNLEASNKKIQIKSNLTLLKNSPNNNSNSENQINKLKKLEQELKNIKIKNTCSVCLDKDKDMVFLCGHSTCQPCGNRLENCPECRKKIEKRIKTF